MRFPEAILKLAEEGHLETLLERIQDRLDTVQQVLDDGEGIALHKAQGEKKSLVWLLEVPEEILRELHPEEDQ